MEHGANTDTIRRRDRTLDYRTVEAWRERLEGANPPLFSVFELSRNMAHLRRLMFEQLAETEHTLSDPATPIHPLEAFLVREAITVMRNLSFQQHERRVGFSALSALRRIAHRHADLPRGLNGDFVLEMEHLFLAIGGRARVYTNKRSPIFLMLKGHRAAQARSEDLDRLHRGAKAYMDRYVDGLRPEVIERRRESKRRVIDALGGDWHDWADWSWHIKHAIHDSATLSRVVNLTEAERAGIDLAVRRRVPFGITPHYASLMDVESTRERDHAIRAQVIPARDYVMALSRGRARSDERLDFMGERDTTPVPLIGRRYPMICILKAASTCPQICVYCQRNWEIQDPRCESAFPTKRALKRAIDWISEHDAIIEVLVTGGDPLMLPDEQLDWILGRLASIDHVERVRIGSRIPATLPHRLTTSLVEMLGSYHEPGHRELALVTHVEHAYEATPEMVEAVQRVRRLGISVYNQMVFTVENSRRFEAAATRRLLRLVGIEPYYTFNTKGKRETSGFRVPIARLLQEQKEEARLMPGLVRTDTVVYNLPRLGKNPLTSAQHHALIGILPDGRRVYEFHPWEKKLSLVDTYVGTDVPIGGYLRELERRGEDPANYESIWYYY